MLQTGITVDFLLFWTLSFFTMRSLREEVQPQQGVGLCFAYALTKWSGYLIRSLAAPGL